MFVTSLAASRSAEAIDSPLRQTRDPAAGEVLCEVSKTGAAGHFATIQSAINTAACTEIYVYNDTFQESLVISRNVKLQGTSFQAGVLQTFVSGVGPGPVISVTNNAKVYLLKLQLINGGSAACTTAGGIDNSGSIQIEKVRVRSGNCPGGTGGIRNTGVITGFFLDVWDNTGGGALASGGLFNQGTFNVSGTAFLRNAHKTVNNSGTGGGIHNRGTMTLTATSIISNVASSGAGIANTGSGNLWLANATVGSNYAHRSTSPSYPHRGSGLFADGGTSRIWFSTFTDNRYLPALGSATFEDAAGATLWQQSGAVQVSSSILHRTAITGTLGNCQGTLAGTGPNIDSDGSCGLGSARAPLFDPAKPLGFNAGALYVPQYTRWVLPNSPSLNAGDNTLCNHPALESADQLGTLRFTDGVCDIGAIEMPWGYAGSTGPTSTPIATAVVPTATSTATPVGTTPTSTPTATPVVPGPCSATLPPSAVAIASVSSDEPGSWNFASFAIDGDPNSLWHTRWINTPTLFPHEIVIDTKQSRNISCLSYLPRQDAPFSRIRGYEIFVSANTTAWGAPVAAGDFLAGATERNVSFTATTGRYVRLVALSSQDGSSSASAAEIKIGATGITSATATPITTSPTLTPVAPTATPTPAPNACGPVLARAGWALKSASSEEPGSYNFARFAFDGSVDSYWHTQWISAVPTYPHEIQIDLGASVSLACFSYLPRQDNAIARVKTYEFYVSADGVTWGTPAATGTFAPGQAESRINFGNRVGRFIRLRAINAYGGEAVAAVAELNVFAPAGPVTSQLGYIETGDSPAIKVPDVYSLYLVLFAGKHVYLPVSFK